MATVNEGPRTWFDVSPAEIEAAREALTEGRPLTSVSVTTRRDGTVAPLIPMTTRIALFQEQVEITAHAAKRAKAPAEAIDALLAVAITLSERFPEAG
jgi:hypothetical protein